MGISFIPTNAQPHQRSARIQWLIVIFPKRRPFFPGVWPSQQRPSLVLQEFQCQLINIRTLTPRHHWKLREKHGKSWVWTLDTGCPFQSEDSGFPEVFLRVKRFWGSKLKNKAKTWIRSTNPTLYHVQRIIVEVDLPEIAFQISEWWLHHAMFEKHLPIMFWFPVGVPL